MSSERRLLVVLLCAPLLGFIGVMAAHAVPNSRIADHLIDAGGAGILADTSELGPTPLGTTAANYTECTAFSLGLADVAGEDVVAHALLGTAYTGCERLGAALDEYVDSGELPSGYSYLRYWHGYSILTRPGLGLFGVAGTRWLAFAFMAVAVGGMCAAVRRSFGTAPAVLLLAPTLLTTDVVIGSLSTSTAIGTGSAWVAGWLSFVLVRDRPAWRRAALVAALAGAVTAYLDLMTTMPGSYALTVAGATLGAMAAGVRLAGQGLWRVSAAGAGGWAIGLAGMWASKWLIASLVVGPATVMDAVTEAIEFRLSSGTHGVTDSRVRGLTINVGGVVEPTARAVGGVRDACRRRRRRDQVAALQRRTRIDGGVLRPGRCARGELVSGAQQPQPDPSSARVPLTTDRVRGRGRPGLRGIEWPEKPCHRPPRGTGGRPRGW